MPPKDSNPGDAAAERQRQDDEKRAAELKAAEEQKARDAKAGEEQKNTLPADNRSQTDAEIERRRLAADAASPEGQAAANLAAYSHFSEEEARAEVERSIASRDPTQPIHDPNAMPYSVAGDATWGLPPASPQNTIGSQNTPLEASVVPVAAAQPGVMGLPPYSPQNNPKDGPRTDTSTAAGVQRQLTAIAGENEKTVPMFFPRPLRLTLDDHSFVSFPGGSVSQVPEHVADHWYLRNSGAKRV